MIEEGKWKEEERIERIVRKQVEEEWKNMGIKSDKREMRVVFKEDE